MANTINQPVFEVDQKGRVFLTPDSRAGLRIQICGIAGGFSLSRAFTYKAAREATDSKPAKRELQGKNNFSGSFSITLFSHFAKGVLSDLATLDEPYSSLSQLSLLFESVKKDETGNTAALPLNVIGPFFDAFKIEQITIDSYSAGLNASGLGNCHVSFTAVNA